MRTLMDGAPPEGWIAAIWRRIQIREGWLSVLLLVVAMLSTVWSVESAGWVSKLPSLSWISLVAIAFGVVFAKMHFRGLVLHPIAIVYGIGIIAWQTMSVINLPTWEERFVDLVLRLNAWAYAARTGGINTDSLVFVFTLVSLTWLLGYLSAWFVFRSHRIWWGVVPSGVAILTNLRYAPADVAQWFMLYLFASMLLFIRLGFYLQERHWEESQVKYSPRMSNAYLPTAILLCAVILAVAWVAPTSEASTTASDAWQMVNSPWQNFQTEFNRLFASLNSEVKESYSSFGRTLVLKGPVNLSTKIIMLVGVDEPHYWRATSYDNYVGRGWINRDRLEVTIRPSASIVGGKQYEQRKEITQTITLLSPKNDVLLAAGQPVRLSLLTMAETVRTPSFTIDLADKSRDANLPPEVRRYADGIRRSVDRARADGLFRNPPWPTSVIAELPPGYEVNRMVGRDPTAITGVELVKANPYPRDVAALRVPQQLKKGQEYSVVSSVSIATERQLRAAGTSYPDWVAERYLQLTPDFPPRVAELAQTITKDATNPYDKALAIQSYLRKIKYNQNIDAPPATMDPVEYFLFISREGYCDYYASAMVTMLRSQGIPARIAAGYLTGSFDTDKGEYVVRDANAHSWPEVFFPRYGWIEFEPTASVDAIRRPADEGSTEAAEPDSAAGATDEMPIDEELLDDLLLPEDGLTFQTESQAIPWAGGIVAILAFCASGAMVWLGWQRGLSKLTLPSQVYEKMCRLASWGGLGPQPTQTPYEYSNYLGHAIPGHAGDVTRITEAYTAIRFGRKNIDADESGGIERAWQRVRRRLIRLIFARR